MPSDDPNENLQALSDHIMRYFKVHNVQHHYKNLNKLTMISKKDGYPKLKGKAAEVKSMGPALLSAWQHWQNPNVEMHEKNWNYVEIKCTDGNYFTGTQI